MATATTDKPKTKPPYYPALETLAGDCPPTEGEHVYVVKDATGRAYYVKAATPWQAAQKVVSVERVPQRSIMFAMSQALLNRKTESGE